MGSDPILLTYRFRFLLDLSTSTHSIIHHLHLTYFHLHRHYCINNIPTITLYQISAASSLHHCSPSLPISTVHHCTCYRASVHTAIVRASRFVMFPTTSTYTLQARFDFQNRCRPSVRLSLPLGIPLSRIHCLLYLSLLLYARPLKCYTCM